LRLQLRAGPEVPAELPACGDAVFGRGWSYFSNADCRGGNQAPGPLPPGSGKRDRLPLDGGELLDVVGNVAEYAADRLNLGHEACWAGAGILHDPLCTTVGALGVVDANRGGTWNAGPLPASRTRGGFTTKPPGDTGLYVTTMHGFRCARPAVPAEG